MDRAGSIGEMEGLILVNIRMEKRMGMEFTNGNQVKSMKEIGKKGK